MSDTTLQAPPDIARDTPEAVESYLRAWALVNGYTEPARPSALDLRTLAGELAPALAPVVSQQEWSPAGTLDLTEGRSFRLTLSPGIIGARSLDVLRLDRTQDRQADARTASASMLAAFADPYTGELPDLDGPSRSEVTEWSAKSRANMVRTLASLDYSPGAWPAEDGALAMVTLTLPGDWLTVAPTGRHFKQLIRKMQLRWTRALGKGSWRGLWKLEFQERGAPHLHMLMRVPALVKKVPFEEWLARTWVAVVDPSDVVDGLDKWGNPDSERRRMYRAHRYDAVDFSGKDFSDPRRIALYFLGHSAKSQDGKEYQHIVPEAWRAPGAGPGRFWGYWGLEKAEVELELTLEDFDAVRRQLRAASRSRSWTVAVARERGAAHREGRSPRPSHTVRGPRPRRTMHGGVGGLGGGWVLLNDAPAFARALVRWLELRRQTEEGTARTFRTVPWTWPLVR